MEIDDLICDLLNEPSMQEDDSVVFTDKALELIHEIAEKCRDIPVAKESQKRMEEYAAGLSAGEVYVDMLMKIAAAPTTVHMRMSARLLAPIISEKIKNSRKGLEGNR